MRGGGVKRKEDGEKKRVHVVLLFFSRQMFFHEGEVDGDQQSVTKLAGVFSFHISALVLCEDKFSPITSLFRPWGGRGEGWGGG